MRLLKICGIVLALTAILCGICVMGHAQTEDRRYAMGEIEADEMTSGEQLGTWFAVSACGAVCGGALWTIGSYIEAEEANRELKKKYRYAERLKKWENSKEQSR